MGGEGLVICGSLYGRGGGGGAGNLWQSLWEGRRGEGLVIHNGRTGAPKIILPVFSEGGGRGEVDTVQS